MLTFACATAWSAGSSGPGATRIVAGKGKIVPIPADIPHQAGSMIDRRVIGNLRWMYKRFPFYVTEGFAGHLRGRGKVGCPECHVRGSDHHNGLAVDLVATSWTPRCNGSWGAVTRLARWAEPRQNVPASPFRWVGYDRDAGHGCGHHLHLSWNHAPAKYSRVARWVQVFRVRASAVQPSKPASKKQQPVPKPRREYEPTGGTAAPSGHGTGGVRPS